MSGDKGQWRLMRLLVDMRSSARTLPAFAAQGYCWGAFAALAPEIKSGLGASDAQFGLALLCAAIGALLAMSAAPRADRLLEGRGQAATAAALTLAFLLAGAAPALPAFAVSMFCAGAAAGLLDVIMNARVSEAEARDGRALMGLNHAAFSLAYAASAAATGLAREAEWDAPQVYATLIPLTAVLALFMRAEPELQSGGAADGAGNALGPLAVLAGLVAMVAFLAENATEGWSALHIERTLGGGAAEGALGPAVLGLTMAAGRLAGHLATVRGREGRAISWAAAMSAAGALSAAAAPSPGAAYAGFAALGLGVSVIAPMVLGMAGAMAPAGMRSLVVGRVVLIGFLGFFLGPPMMGFVSESLGLRAAFALIGAALLAIPALVAALLRVKDGTPGA